jgi:predicted dehydrogenase
VSVAGFGTMGRKHTASCKGIDGVEVVAVSALDEAEADAIRAEAGVPAYLSAERMLAEVPADALIVATPPGVRRDLVHLAAGEGKALFVEKPIALDLATADGYCREVSAGGMVNAVGFQLRHSPVAERAREIIKGRTVTHVRTACTTGYYLNRDVPDWFLQREHSGGPLLEQAIHVIDMARYLVGDITHVFCRGHRLTHSHVAELDSEDTIVLAYQFAKGVLGTHTDSCGMMEFNWEIELLGPDWRLLLDFARKRLVGHADGAAIRQDFEDLDLHLREMQAFVNAVRANDPAAVRCDFADATETLATVLAGDRSMRDCTWEPVRR